MSVIILYTSEGVHQAAITACREKLAENGLTTVSVKPVVSPFDFVPAFQSTKKAHGIEPIYLILGAAVGTSGTESASAAFNLMSVSLAGSRFCARFTMPRLADT
jgi:hypothetical protein